MGDSKAVPHWYRPGDERLSIERGDGTYVVASDGTTYLDFCAQLYCVNAGHGETRITDAMADQLGRVQYVAPSKHNDARTALADRLVDVAPDGLSEVFFAVSGSEANETAAQLARQVTDAPTVLSRWRSYHGGTYGAGSFTGDPALRATIERYAATTGAGKFLPPIPDAFGTDDPEELARRAADHLDFVIRNEGADAVAAVVMEPVAGTSGAYDLPADYAERVRAVCDEHDVLLVADEVITGFGRCGEWFGCQSQGLDPDLLTFAKGITSAYAPLAGVLVNAEVAAHVREEGYANGQTFGGHPVACAAGVAAMDVYADGLIENVREVAPTLGAELSGLERHPEVDAVRGTGFLWSVEFADPDTGDPFFDPRTDEGHNPVDDVVAGAQERGVLVGSGRPPTQVIVAPPLVADAADVEEGVAALDAAVEETAF